MTKLLVIDDDESILDALSLIFTEAGYSVEAIAKGEETYNTVTRFKPDVILLDVLMSGKDGREICKNLKSSDTTKQIPIIMISAHPSAQNSIQDCGADEFLSKPFDTENLLKTVKKYL